MVANHHALILHQELEKVSVEENGELMGWTHECLSAGTRDIMGLRNLSIVACWRHWICHAIGDKSL